jgi:hypothetical protein
MSNPGTTHSESCYKWHLECAVARVEHLQGTLLTWTRVGHSHEMPTAPPCEPCGDLWEAVSALLAASPAPQGFFHERCGTTHFVGHCPLPDDSARLYAMTASQEESDIDPEYERLERLMPYVQHKDSCILGQHCPPGCTHKSMDCTCGLHALLGSLQDEGGKT